MPRLSLSLELEPAESEHDGALPCVVCGGYGCEWKLRFPGQVMCRGIHTRCKVTVERQEEPVPILQEAKTA